MTESERNHVANLVVRPCEACGRETDTLYFASPAAGVDRALICRDCLERGDAPARTGRLFD